jgi:predicted Rossmann fold nucleotide-binding protein DprA/Smf involved in DNA uptake
MKQVQSQLKTVAKTLADLAGKIEKISAQLGAPAAAAPAPKKKKPASVKKKAAAPVKETEAQKDTVLDSVMDVIKKSRNGANIAQLKDKTGLESRQLSNALYKLSKKGKIKSKARGVYIKA